MTKFAITAALACAVLVSGCDLIHIKGQGKSAREAEAAAEAAKAATPAPAVVAPVPDVVAPPTATNPNMAIEKVGTAGYCDIYTFERGGAQVYVASVTERRSSKSCALAIAPAIPADIGSAAETPPAY